MVCMFECAGCWAACPPIWIEHVEFCVYHCCSSKLTGWRLLKDDGGHEIVLFSVSSLKKNSVKHVCVTDIKGHLFPFGKDCATMIFIYLQATKHTHWTNFWWCIKSRREQRRETGYIQCPGNYNNPNKRVNTEERFHDALLWETLVLILLWVHTMLFQTLY